MEGQSIRRCQNLEPVGNATFKYRLISIVAAVIYQLALGEFDYCSMSPRAKMQQHFIS